MIRSSEALVGHRYAERQSGLSRNDTIRIPPADERVEETVAMAQESAVDADRDFPDYVCHKTLTDVESRFTHFGAVVIGVLRLRSPVLPVDVVSQAMAPGVIDPVA